MPKYRIAERLSDGLFGVVSTKYGQQLWASCKTRQRFVCALSGEPIKPGSEVIRPITNGQNRRARMLLSEVIKRCPEGEANA